MPNCGSARRSLSVTLVAVLGCVALFAGCADVGVHATNADTAATAVPVTDPPVESVPSSSLPATAGGDAQSAGDELFPTLGSATIDVQHYDIQLAYDAPSDRIDAVVTIDLTVTEDLDVVYLDADGPQVATVTVDGQDTTFEDLGGKLAIDLPSTLPKGTSTTLVITYSVDPRGGTGSSGLPSGWFNTVGGSYTLNEPDGAHSWLPSNDHPSDKATYSFRITVAPGVTAVANGALVAHTTTAEGEVWEWREDRPMTTYLVQVLTGDYEVVEGSGPRGLPLTHAVLRSEAAAAAPLFDLTARQIEFYEQWFGPYPLDRYGLAITDSSSGLAMETQERSLFSRDDLVGGADNFMVQLLLSHELAHQWFGDAVSPADWSDIWLNESFATYGQWMWLEHAGFGTVDESAHQALFTRPTGSSAEPTAEDLFGYNSYDGGAVVLHALRLTIGDDDFFTLLQRWVSEHNGTSRTTDDFIEMASDVSGTDLTAFFDEWLFAPEPPSQFP